MQLFEPETLIQPFEFYQRVILESPVAYDPEQNIYLVTSYELVTAIVEDVERFSSEFGELMNRVDEGDPEIKALLDEGFPRIHVLPSSDPPRHTRYRRLVSSAFTMPKVKKMEEEIERTVVELIDDFADHGHCEFISAFAVKLLVMVIMRLLGAPEVPIEKAKAWSDAAIDLLGGFATRERQIECLKLGNEAQHFFKAKIDERRADESINDMVASLVHAKSEDFEPLNDVEILAVINSLMVAGNESTTATIGESVYHLTNDGDGFERINSDPKLLNLLVEELLRLATPVQGMWRIATCDVEVAGVTIPAGSMVHLRFATANRDPKNFESPDSLEFDRKSARSHLAFGKGAHVCVGNMLARKEIEISLRELSRRFTDIRMTSSDSISYQPNFLTRGPAELHISFSPR